MSRTFEIQIDQHKLVALAFNPDASGHPIILLHGVTSSIHFWNVGSQLSLFLRRGPCYAVSLPGHYPATFPLGFRENMLTSEMLAYTLSKAIQKLVGKQPVTLVGHSTGGLAALAIAAYIPNIVQRLICISGFAKGKWTGVLGFNQRLMRCGPIGEALVKKGYSLTRSRILFRESFRIYAASAHRFFSYPYLKMFLADMFPDFQNLDLNAMSLYFRAMPDIDISHLLPNITVPTLVLTGDSDPIVPFTQACLIKEKVRHAELQTLKGAGHLPFVENTTEYRRALSRWLCLGSLKS